MAYKTVGRDNLLSHPVPVLNGFNLIWSNGDKNNEIVKNGVIHGQGSLHIQGVTYYLETMPCLPRNKIVPPAPQRYLPKNLLKRHLDLQDLRKATKADKTRAAAVLSSASEGRYSFRRAAADALSEEERRCFGFFNDSVAENEYRKKVSQTIQDWRLLLKAGRLMISDCAEQLKCAQRELNDRDVELLFWDQHMEPFLEEKVRGRMVLTWTYELCELTNVFEGL